MKEINLRDYYPFYTNDLTVEVPDEVADLLRDTLTEKQRQRIYAHFFLGMSNADIARLEGCDITSVRDGIKRGLRQLEKYFEKNLL